ncbi:MAG: GC-type dockerin domain-anchored protein, partial [Phycisphaerales bacterium JB061]
PGSMALLSDYQVIQEHELMGFTLKDNHIIFVTSHSELIIVNVSDPSQPSVEWVHTHPPPAYYHHHRIHMSVDDDLLVYSSDSTDYNFLDVSDLSNVAWLQTVSPQGHAAKPILRNGRAYLYDEFLGLEIYDITDPTNIFRIGLSGARHSTYGFTFLDDEICVIGGNIYGCDIVRTGSDCSTACPADANHDGSLSPADFSAWVAAFNTHAPECDQNNDGSCTPADFSAWVANYNAGC